MNESTGRYLLSLTLALSLAQPSFAQEVTSSASKDVSLTIYNQNFGLVRDVRQIELKNGVSYLRFEDVAAQIDPTSVSLVSLTAPNAVVVREQNYQYDLLNPTTILNKSIGKQVKFRQFLPAGQMRELSGTLLNAPEVSVSDTEGNVTVRGQGLVVQTAEGVVLDPQGQAELAELPPGLVPKPSLLWKLESTKAGAHDTEISYQTGGLNWRCDYVTVVNQDDTKADLTSWVTIDNKSGATFKKAALKLLAGDVHRVQMQPVYRHMAATEEAAAASPPPQFKEQAFAEYHLYTLQGRTDVNDRETKQLSLFNTSDVPVKKLFIFEPERAVPIYVEGSETSMQKVQIKLEVENSEANRLGMPMPKGKVRVYKKDEDGALQFIGEDMIDHTPRDEKIRLYIGDAFDVVGERKQTNVIRVSSTTDRISYEISLRNHKKTAATVTAVEHAYGQWKIIQASHPHKKKDARTFEFSVAVPANGTVNIAYTIEIKHL